MDELSRFMNGPECAVLGQALLHSLRQGAAIAGLLAVVNWRLGARGRYGAACTALAILTASQRSRRSCVTMRRRRGHSVLCRPVAARLP